MSDLDIANGGEDFLGEGVDPEGLALLKEVEADLINAGWDSERAKLFVEKLNGDTSTYKAEAIVGAVVGVTGLSEEQVRGGEFKGFLDIKDADFVLYPELPTGATGYPTSIRVEVLVGDEEKGVVEFWINPAGKACLARDVLQAEGLL